MANALTANEQQQQQQQQQNDGLVQSPMVFQCKSCRTIVGDSFAFLRSDEEAMAITLSSASPGVRAESELVTSMEGRDLGSSFSRLTCASCNVVIGKMYRTTPRDLDSLRGAFTFDVRLLSSYQLGTTTEGQHTTIEDILSTPSVKSLEIDILRIQQLLVSLHERLEDLESSIGLPSVTANGHSNDTVDNPPADNNAAKKRPRRTSGAV